MRRGEHTGYGNPVAPSASVRRTPNVSVHFDAPTFGYDADVQPVYGRLATDRTHQLRAQLLYSFPFGLTVGASQFVGSGTPRTEWASVVAGPYPTGHPPHGRGNLGDTPWLTQTDLMVVHRWPLGGGQALSLGATILNLFDEDTPTRFISGRNLDPLPVTMEEFFQGYDYDALIGTVDQDPAYGMADTFQPAREIRLTLRYEF